jgi:hypothetical protein
MIKDNPSRLLCGIHNSLTYLSINQLEYGEFRTNISKDPEMEVCCFDSSPFVTSQVLYSLSFIDNPLAEKMIEMGTAFLIEEMTIDGLWRYWTKRHQSTMIPDIDDTCCASFIVKKKIPDIASLNLNTILCNRTDRGLFKTWIRDPSYERNDVDSVANANVVLYLGEREETAAACRYIIKSISGNREHGTFKYYIDALSLYYAVSRAYFNGITSFGILIPKLADKIVHLQNNDGSFGNELLTGLAVCTLLNIGSDEEAVMEDAVQYLLSQQYEDGSFRRIAYYQWPESPTEILFWFGSEELTTSICLEALVRYSNRITSVPEG